MWCLSQRPKARPSRSEQGHTARAWRRRRVTCRTPRMRTSGVGSAPKRNRILKTIRSGRSMTTRGTGTLSAGTSLLAWGTAAGSLTVCISHCAAALQRALQRCKRGQLLYACTSLERLPPESTAAAVQEHEAACPSSGLACGLRDGAARRATASGGRSTLTGAPRAAATF